MPLGYTMENVWQYTVETLKIQREKIEKIEVSKEGIDNSDKNNIVFKLSVLATLKDSKDEEHLSFIRRNKGCSYMETLNYTVKKEEFKNRPVVVGFGPAGIFAALILAEKGARPIVLERGMDVDTRRKDIENFQKTGNLNTNSNIQFGEGGAGTYSDGKLKTGLVDKTKYKILTELVLAGAPENILYKEKPHVGSNNLHDVVKKLRKKIISLGGEIHFGATLTEIYSNNSAVTGVKYIKNNKEFEILCSDVILAIGHSARETFRYLNHIGVAMEGKGFGVGVRIEHPQSLINSIQYGKFDKNENLSSADYRFVTHLKSGRSVYTFCMCPGGYVVPATSEENQICTNGMSEFNRDGENANSAILVSVTPKDFLSESPLSGMDFQIEIEKKGFISAGGGYKAPVQKLCDFMQQEKSREIGEVKPTYLPGVTPTALEDFLPAYVTTSMREAFSQMFSWFPGYKCNDALLTGPETRTTSPIRITRTKNLESVTLKGLYPCGEGAGFAGGIISSAVDGIKCAEKIKP